MALNLQVIIIGGGLIGLTTAIALRRIGHSVKVSGNTTLHLPPCSRADAVRDLREIILVE